MNPTTFTNNPTPDRGADFDYGDGTYCRVCITLDSDPASTDPSVRYLAQAFQVDANGDFVLDAAGAPITHGEREVKPVMKSGLISVPPQYTMKAGWVAYQPQQGGTIDPNALPSGWTSGDTLPASASVGDKFWNTSNARPYVYSAGILAGWHTHYATLLRNKIAPSTGSASLY